MQLSTKARYATRAMIELALSYGEGLVQLKELARRLDVSDKYLEQVMFPLRVKGFIYTQKGNRGGYSLSQAPENITLNDIVQTVEGSLAPVTCVDNEEYCHRSEVCVTKDVWAGLKEKIVTELESVTLAHLAGKHLEKQENEAGEVVE